MIHTRELVNVYLSYLWDLPCSSYSQLVIAVAAHKIFMILLPIDVC